MKVDKTLRKKKKNPTKTKQIFIQFSSDAVSSHSYTSACIQSTLSGNFVSAPLFKINLPSLVIANKAARIHLLTVQVLNPRLGTEEICEKLGIANKKCHR